MQYIHRSIYIEQDTPCDITYNVCRPNKVWVRSRKIPGKGNQPRPQQHQQSIAHHDSHLLPAVESAIVAVGSVHDGIRLGTAPVTDTRYTNPCDALAIACIRSRGVVGVVSKTSSMPALLAASLISPVSSSGISGTKRPGMQATSVEQPFMHCWCSPHRLVTQIPDVCNDQYRDKQC